MNKKTLSLAFAAAGITVGGVGVAQMASAQTPEDPAVEADTPENDTETSEDEDGRRGRRHGGGCNQEALAEVLGMEVDELRAALQSGQSVADIAEANGVDTQAVVDALVAQTAERLDAKVEEGQLTSEEAAEKLADKTERIEDGLDDVRTGEGRRGDRRGGERSDSTDETSDVANLST